ncbi:hypothetical protein ACIQUB_08340 [Rhizobium sp. NPDC090275]|uniref:hypothetical protein n=1 Tax=Rhizobium sp. NPDC090275 TaxID=3364498 RepID=UPI00383AD688
MADRHHKALDEPSGIVSQLRDMHRRLCRGHSLTDDQCSLLVSGIGNYLYALDNGASPSLDKAIGLKAWGGVSAGRQDALSRRDDLIRRLWRSQPDWQGLPPAAAAKLMQQSAERYANLRWPRECDLIVAPSAEPAATWWRILSSGERIPGSSKRLQQILNVEIQGGV